MPDESAGSLDTQLAADLATLDRANLRRVPHLVAGRRDALLTSDGAPCVDFASNDYLGLAADPRIAAALAEAAAWEGTGAAASRLITGSHRLHAELEARIAAFKRTASAITFTSGYAANCGAIPALARRGDVIYADALNHASLIDACKLSRAETKVFAHNDLDALEALLAADASHTGRKWIVVDSVFSMDGDCCPLDHLVLLAEKHGAFTYVDDAHGTGVLGANGRGAAEHFGVEGRIDVVMGTLGKGIGTSGAFIAGSTLLTEWLYQRARTFVFTTAPSPALAAATIAAIDVVEAEPWRWERVRAVAQRIRAGVAGLGYPAPGPEDGHIIAVVIGEAAETARLGEALRARGKLVGAVRPPTVPLGSARLRITASAAHTDAQVDGLIAVLGEELVRGEGDRREQGTGKRGVSPERAKDPV